MSEELSSSYLIQINGTVDCVQAASADEAHDLFLDAFIAFIESNGWLFGGGTRAITDEELTAEFDEEDAHADTYTTDNRQNQR